MHSFDDEDYDGTYDENESDEEEPDKGYCCRYAPRPVMEGQMNKASMWVAFWPETYGTNWCGDFEPS